MDDADIPAAKLRDAMRHSPTSRTMERNYLHKIRPTVGGSARAVIEARFGAAQ
jgi:hypothetical protein